MKDKTFLEDFRRSYPDKFVPEDQAFSHIHAGDRTFIGTGCDEPQYLIHALMDYTKSHPKACLNSQRRCLWRMGR